MGAARNERGRRGGGSEGMKVPELKAACKERNLPTTGKKANLVRRLDECVRGKAKGVKKEGGTMLRPPAPARAGGVTENDDIMRSLRDLFTSDLPAMFSKRDGAIVSHLGQLRDPDHNAYRQRAGASSGMAMTTTAISATRPGRITSTRPSPQNGCS